MEVPKMIFCRGGNPKVAKIAIRLGFMYGTRSDHSVGKGLRCDGLIDVNWKSYNWEAHLEMVARHRPLLACVPDIMERSKVESTLLLAEQLSGLCDHVIVIPKLHSIVDLIPEQMVIGVSIPSKYAGFLPYLSEIKNRRVHLLGGSPKKQLEIGLKYKQSNINVFSIDGNGVCLTAGLKKYWDCEGCNWRRNTKLDYYKLIEKSLINWRQSWDTLWEERSYGIQRTLGSGTKGFFDFS